MRNLLGPGLLLLLTVGVQAAPQAYNTGRQGPSKILFEAMDLEMARTVSRLHLPKLPKGHFVSFGVRETHRLSIDGEFGAIKQSNFSQNRQLRINLRVGSAAFDNAHYYGPQTWFYSQPTAGLPIEDDLDALRAEIWRLADRAYKTAVERFSQKTAFREAKNIKEIFPDLSEDPVKKFETTVEVAPFDRELWETRAKSLSKILRSFRTLKTGNVGVYFNITHDYFIDSQGRRFVKPRHDFDLWITARAQSSDGMPQFGSRRFIVRRSEDIPSMETLRKAVKAVGREVTDLTKAPQGKAYIGPVLLEGQAAGEFFNQMFAGGLTSPREIWSNQGSVGHSGALTSRLGLRVLAPDFDAFDDPTQKEFDGETLLGHYEVDDEGIPASRVDLVSKGNLKNLIMSRSPVKERTKSTGHGRAGFGEEVAARVGNLFVKPASGISREELRLRLIKEAKAFGLDHAIVVRRLGRSSSKPGTLGKPNLIYRVDLKTGEETLLRDCQFTGTSLRALRDVIASSKKLRVYNFYQASATPLTPSEIQASLVHPDVLLAEMEVKKSDEKPKKLPYLKNPLFN